MAAKKSTAPHALLHHCSHRAETVLNPGARSSMFRMPKGPNRRISIQSRACRQIRHFRFPRHIAFKEKPGSGHEHLEVHLRSIPGPSNPEKPIHILKHTLLQCCLRNPLMVAGRPAQASSAACLALRHLTAYGAARPRV